MCQVLLALFCIPVIPQINFTSRGNYWNTKELAANICHSPTIRFFSEYNPKNFSFLKHLSDYTPYFSHSLHKILFLQERHSAEPLSQDTWTSAKPIFYLDYIFISYYNRKVKNVVFHQTFKKKRGTHCEKIRRIHPEYS